MEASVLELIQSGDVADLACSVAGSGRRCSRGAALKFSQVQNDGASGGAAEVVFAEPLNADGAHGRAHSVGHSHPAVWQRRHRRKMSS